MFTPEPKTEVVRRHVAGKELVSDLADQFGLPPSQILDQAERAFAPNRRGRPPANAENLRVAELKAAIARKDAVVVELLQQVARLLFSQDLQCRVS